MKDCDNLVYDDAAVEEFVRARPHRSADSGTELAANVHKDNSVPKSVGPQFELGTPNSPGARFYTDTPSVYALGGRYIQC
jgi:hypothetical protein